jgi:hypothetical protein
VFAAGIALGHLHYRMSKLSSRYLDETLAGIQKMLGHKEE